MTTRSGVLVRQRVPIRWGSYVDGLESTRRRSGTCEVGTSVQLWSHAVGQGGGDHARCQRTLAP